MNLLITCFLLMVSLANAEEMYFLQKDGRQSILYKTNCANETCSIKALSINSEGGVMSCRLDLYSFFEDEKAVKAGESWIITDSSGGCGYTNIYVISKNGMTQTKTSPSKIKDSFCETFPPKIYKMEPTTKSKGLSVAGCKEIYPSGF